MKSLIRLWWNSDVVVLVRRVGILFLALALCRVVFYCYNSEIIGSLGWGEAGRLIKGALLFDTISIVYAFGIFIVLSLLPLKIRERKWYQRVLFWYFIIIGAVVVALNLADVPYFHYTGIRLTAADVLFADNDNTGQLIGRFAAENWYLVLVWAILTVAMGWLYRYAGKPRTPIKNVWVYGGVNLVILACAGVLCLAMARGGSLARTTRPVTMSNAMAYAQTPPKANLVLSNPFCILRTTSNKGIRYKKYFTTEELSSIFTPYHYPAEDMIALSLLSDVTQDGQAASDGAILSVQTSALARKSNVVIFVLESFSAEHSALLNPDLYPHGKGYTPFLDSLMREGYYFTRAYATGRKSIDALPSVLSSMPSFKKPFVTMPQGMGEGMQLPKILAREGYNTLFFCGSPNGSMGFDAYANLAGVGQFYDKDTYDKRYPGNADFDGFWGVWDEPFIDYMGEVLDGTEQPFMSSIFTLSSHHPFRVPEQYEDVLPEGTTKNHRPIAYTDVSLRRFFDKYKDSEWFDNTLFVFVADHVSSERFAPKTETSVGSHHIISFMYTPDGSLAGADDHVFQQADIMPSVLGYLGYNRPYFAFGRDVFREDRQPMAVNYSYDFQMITDSLVMRFDEQQVTGVYAMTDTLMLRNIADPEDSTQVGMERTLKAVIQQYYSHLETRTYLVPD